MFCPRCGKPVPAGAAFCPACGSPVAPASTRPPAAASPQAARPVPAPSAPRTAVPAGAAPAVGVAADFEAQQRRTRLTMAGVGTLALIAALFGARSLGLLRLGGASPRAGLQVRGEGPESALQLPSSVPPPGLQLPGKAATPSLQEPGTRKVMPADVEAWLKHLEECERIKQSVVNDQASSGMTAQDELEAQKLKQWLDDDPDSDSGKAPNQYAKEHYMDKFSAPWIALKRKFLSVNPPQECVAIASSYNTGLSQMPDVMHDLGEVLAGDLSHPDEAIKAAKQALPLSQVATTNFRQTDDGVAAICSKYEKAKWFGVTGINIDGPGGLGMFGGLGGQSGSGLPGMGQ